MTHYLQNTLHSKSYVGPHPLRCGELGFSEVPPAFSDGVLLGKNGNELGDLCSCGVLLCIDVEEILENRYW